MPSLSSLLVFIMVGTAAAGPFDLFWSLTSSMTRAVDSSQNTIDLINAVWGNRINKVVKVLGRPATDVNGCDKNGMTALHWAAYHGHHDIVMTLLDQKSIDINAMDKQMRTPLLLAIFADQRDCVALLFYRPEVDVNFAYENSRTALHWATRLGHLDVVSLIVANQYVDLLKVDSSGETAAMIAARKGYSHIATAIDMSISNQFTTSEPELDN